MANNEIKAYVLKISTDELFEHIHDEKGERLLAVLKKKYGFYGVSGVPSKRDYNNQYFLFDTRENRDKAIVKILKIGFNTVTPVSQVAYIDRKFII